MLGALGRGLEAAEHRLCWLAHHKGLAVVLAGALSLTARAVLLPVLPIPKPAIQDEFSYLLASDTFASGRLTNATPPFAEHFETLQVLMHPTYASKYPPFSAAMMALGQKLAGQPWMGVWLSTGILCSALCWALQGWLPPVWAFAGSLLGLARIGVVSYWTESYWGGACAAIGGALVIGALPRLMRRSRRGPAFAFAAGLAILANTRPYEGIVLAAACTAMLVYVWLGRPLAMGRFARAVLLPMALLLGTVFLWMGYYNYRVTGNAAEIPYMAHDKQYVVRSPLLWETRSNDAAVYSNAFLQDFWTVAAANENQSARDHWLKAHIWDLITLGRFFLGWPLVICIVAFARPLWHDAAARCALVLAVIFYVGAALDARLFPHYAAPATALVYIVAACSLRALRNAWPGSFAERRYITWGVLGVFIVTTGMGLLAPENRYLFGNIDYHVEAKHARVTEQLERIPGSHLVLVRYGSRHQMYEELVFNEADIERARVVWARSLGTEKDSRLMEHFAGRRIWLLEEDGDVKLSGIAAEWAEPVVARQIKAGRP